MLRVLTTAMAESVSGPVGQARFMDESTVIHGTNRKIWGTDRRIVVLPAVLFAVYLTELILIGE